MPLQPIIPRGGPGANGGLGRQIAAPIIPRSNAGQGLGSLPNPYGNMAAPIVPSTPGAPPVQRAAPIQPGGAQGGLQGIAPPAGGFQGLQGIAPPQSPPKPPAPPAPRMPTPMAPLQPETPPPMPPDASGVTPPPGIQPPMAMPMPTGMPGYQAGPMAVPGGGGTFTPNPKSRFGIDPEQERLNAMAAADRAMTPEQRAEQAAQDAIPMDTMGKPVPAMSAPLTDAAKAKKVEAPRVYENPVDTPGGRAGGDVNRLPPVGERQAGMNYAASTNANRGNGRDNKKDTELGSIDWSNLPVDQSGTPDRDAFETMLQNAGYRYGSREYRQAMNLFENIYKQSNLPDVGSNTSGNRLAREIGRQANRLDAGDPYSFGFGSVTDPGTGDGTGTGTGAGAGTGTGTGTDTGAGSGVDFSQLPDVNDYLNGSTIPDWMRRSPEMAAAMFDWAKYQQEQANRELAAKQYQGLIDLYNNDPTRKAMTDFLGQGVQPTLTPELIEKMKTAGRVQAGQGLSSLDERLRAAAGAAGIPTNNLSALMAGGRTDILNNLLQGERDTEIQAAMQGAQDRDRYFSQLNAAQGSLLGPMAGAYGGLANLIAGGYAGGNPMAGVADYRLAKDAANPTTAWNAQDWTQMGMQGLGTAAKALGGL